MAALLRSNRISLRSVEINRDEEVLYLWENDPDSWASSGAMNPISAEFIKQYILQSSTSILSQEATNLIIQHNDGTPLGYLQIHDYDPISRRCSIGIYIAPTYRRSGYAREALSLAHSYLQSRLNCQMVYASILSNNLASLSLFASLSYCLVGTLSKWQWYDGQYLDLKHYQLCLQ